MLVVPRHQFQPQPLSIPVAGRKRNLSPFAMSKALTTISGNSDSAFQMNPFRPGDTSRNIRLPSRTLSPVKRKANLGNQKTRQPSEIPVLDIDPRTFAAGIRELSLLLVAPLRQGKNRSGIFSLSPCMIQVMAIAVSFLAPPNQEAETRGLEHPPQM
jgi:hypothetical protein